MNSIEYALKLYVKHLLKMDWLNYIFNLFNLTFIFILTVAIFDEHGWLTGAELTEFATGLEMMLYTLIVAPPAAVGVGLVIAKLAHRRWDIERSEEIWPEVEL